MPEASFVQLLAFGAFLSFAALSYALQGLLPKWPLPNAPADAGKSSANPLQPISILSARTTDEEGAVDLTSLELKLNQ